jgi:hypothetical protein
MKLKSLSSLSLFLLLGIAPVLLAQNKPEEQKSDRKQEAKQQHQTDKHNQQEQKTQQSQARHEQKDQHHQDGKVDQRTQKDEQSQARHEQKQADKQERHADGDHRNDSRRDERREIRQSPRSDKRIDEARFRGNFGREHHFHVGRTVLYHGYSRFQYGGYWFGFVEPWPSDWDYDDDCYIDFTDGYYYMYNPYHPNVRVMLTVY